MSGEAQAGEAMDWGLTTWEGARREQMRRWAELPLEELIRALEEMHMLADELSHAVAEPKDR